MRGNKLTILLILGLSLMLRADSCTEEKEVDLVYGSDFVATLQSTEGYTEASDEDEVTVAASDDVLEAIGELEAEFDGPVNTIQINGARFEIIANAGHDAHRRGEIFVKIEDGPPEFKLMDWNTPDNQPGTTGYASANPIDPDVPAILFDVDGLQTLNTALQAFLDDYNEGIARDLEMTLRATWTSSPPPNSVEPDNFRWRAALLFQVNQKAKIDVPTL